MEVKNFKISKNVRKILEGLWNMEMITFCTVSNRFQYV